MRYFATARGCSRVFAVLARYFYDKKLDLSTVPFGKLRWMTATAVGCETFEHFKTIAASRDVQRVKVTPERVAAVQARCLASDA